MTCILGMLDDVVSRIESVMLAHSAFILMAANTVDQRRSAAPSFFSTDLFFSEELNRILIILITFRRD